MQKAWIESRRIKIGLLEVVAVLFCVYRYESTASFLTTLAFLGILIAVSFQDIETRKILDRYWCAIVFLTIVSMITIPEIEMTSRLIGAGCVSIPMFVLTFIVPGFFGGGDMKLMAACGLFLGWKVTLVSTVLAIFAGGAYGIFLLVIKKAERKMQFAFGPFLCAGMAVGMMYGKTLIEWYIRWG